MKRLFCLMLCAVIFTSCSLQGEGEPFSVFDENFSVKISSLCEENVCEFSYCKAESSLTFISPSELDGYKLKTEADGFSLSFDGISVPVSEYAGRLLLICQYVFSVQSADALEITAEKTGEEVFTVVCTDNCKYIFSSSGVPISVSGSYDGIDFKFTFSSFEVSK